MRDFGAIQIPSRQVTSLRSSKGAFCALRSDGSVVCWGDPAAGGDCTFGCLQDVWKVQKYTQIYMMFRTHEHYIYLTTNSISRNSIYKYRNCNFNCQTLILIFRRRRPSSYPLRPLLGDVWSVAPPSTPALLPARCTCASWPIRGGYRGYCCLRWLSTLRLGASGQKYQQENISKVKLSLLWQTDEVLQQQFDY